MNQIVHVILILPLAASWAKAQNRIRWKKDYILMRMATRIVVSGQIRTRQSEIARIKRPDQSCLYCRTLSKRFGRPTREADSPASHNNGG
jgi:hypothetical protein